MKPEDLTWIDEFYQQVKQYIHVREEDSLLILVPNRAHKINRTGMKILKELESGKGILEIFSGNSFKEGAPDKVHHFFCDLRAAVMGCMREGESRLAVEKMEFEQPFNSLPVLSEIAITYRCNLKCRFCYAGGMHRRYHDTSTENLKRMLDVIYHDAEVPSVSFTGGEPTLRSDLPELIEYAAGLGMRVNLITNATGIDAEYAQKLKDSGLSSAQVSLEASTPDLHDRIVMLDGAFHATLNGLIALQEADITVHTNTTLSAMNVEDAAIGMVLFIKSFGLERFSMNMMIPCGSVLKNHSELKLRYSDIGRYLLRIKDKAREENIEFMWYSPTPYCLFNPVAEGLGNKSCAACDGLLSIAPDGSILPCSSYDEPVGNVLETSFREIWNGERAAWFRRKEFVPKKCSDCENRAICTGACPLYWKIFGTDEILPKQKRDFTNRGLLSRNRKEAPTGE